MRLGVDDYVYVHNSFVTPWLINSTSITRYGEGPLLGKRSRNDYDNEVQTKKKKLSLDTFSESVDQMMFDESSDIELFSPQPWLRVNTVLNNRVLHKWLGCILTECITRCGCYISHICVRFNQMHPSSVRRLLDVLEMIGCVELKFLKNRAPSKSLFSKYEHCEEGKF